MNEKGGQWLTHLIIVFIAMYFISKGAKSILPVMTPYENLIIGVFILVVYATTVYG